MRKSSTQINNDIIKAHNDGAFRNWESRSYNYATHQYEVYAETPDRRITMRIEERNPDLDLEEALNDPLNDTQLTFNFENPDPEDKKFSDDVREGQQDL